MSFLIDSVSGIKAHLRGFSSAQELNARTPDVPSQIGYGFSYSFDGAGNWLEAVPDAPYQGDLTIAFWVKWSGVQSAITDGIFSSHSSAPNNSFQIQIGGTLAGVGNFAVRITDSLGVSKDLLFGSRDTSWTHLAIRTIGNTQRLYFNGVPTADYTESWSPTIETYRIGVNRGGTRWANALLDDFRVYHSGLSDGQVASLAAGGEASGASPVFRLPFDDRPEKSASSVRRLQSPNLINSLGR